MLASGWREVVNSAVVARGGTPAHDARDIRVNDTAGAAQALLRSGDLLQKQFERMHRRNVVEKDVA